MNTSALKAFAPAVRRQLLEAIGRKLDYVLGAESPDLLATYAPQVATLRGLSVAGRQTLVDRVAYTWFNRLAALRFMDACGWHEFHARVLTPSTPGETQPELLKLARTGAMPDELRSHVDVVRLNDILDGRIPSSDPQGEVYRHLLLAACRYYNALLPDLFEKLDDETELLLPDDVLTAHSIVHGFRTEIGDEDCTNGSEANVEILGWLYQFYISERKDQVMARKSAVPTEDIPAVTQLFTPHWIVRYLVENSLGRLWLLNRPGSRLREHMPYYIEGEAGTDFLRISKPEEINLCDPACGSGHMLTYAFDLLALIYEEEGYAPTEIPALILRHNLHGLEICPRAVQLAELALVFKAREKSRRFFQPEHYVRPSIIELRDVRFTEVELREYISALGLGDLFLPPVLRMLSQFEAAKNSGSLIQPCLDERGIAFARNAIESKSLGTQLFLRETHLKVLRVLKQAESLAQQYHVVVMNPPYLGGNQMNAKTKHLAQTNFPNSKADLFAMFIERAFGLALPQAFIGMITMQSWMFLSTFQGLRGDMLRERAMINMAHLGARAFDSIGGEVVQAAAFIYENSAAPDRTATFFRLTTGRCEADKAAACREAIVNPDCGWVFRVAVRNFRAIPGSPIAYWLSAKALATFSSDTFLADLAPIREGINTGDNDQFLRLWYEVAWTRIDFCLQQHEITLKKWVPHKKGGGYRRWYGNAEYVLNWERGGVDIHAFHGLPLTYNGAPVRGKAFFFKHSLSWSRISTANFCIRQYPAGFSYDSTAPSIYGSAETEGFVLGFLNSNVVGHLMAALSPTLDYRITSVGRLPLLLEDVSLRNNLTGLPEECVRIARHDWDNFETSWDFRDQPLLRPDLKGATLEKSWWNWDTRSSAAIRRMQELETENNRLFIDAYGLEGELQPDVPEEQITLARAEARRDMAAFLSYAVGCMMGRYSPDHPGLILANAGDSLREFLERVGRTLAELTFTPDEDGIIPVLDGEWFEDDIVARTREFLRATFGEANLEANIRFIEDSVGKDLRRYFLTDFYKDHVQTYKKRPIYWMFQSPRKGFSALVYLHRYTKDTANTMLNRYLRDYLQKMRSRLEHLEHLQLVAATTREKNAARKESDALRKTIRECEEYERDILLPLAQQRIELDLDDGVKVNYLKLGNALAPIAGLAAKESD